jgi:tetratricopeptide (TPR) repeat protein
VKALCRKGIALAAMKDYAGAKEVFNAALVAEPDNEDVKKQLRQSLARQKREKAEEKKMAQKMFG